MILNFLNPSTFAHETADFKLAYLQSAFSLAKNDGFKKIQNHGDLFIPNDRK